MTPPADEPLLIARTKAGDDDAFAVIVQHYHQPIYAHIYRTMGDADMADDLTQDTFLKAYCAISRTTDDLNLSAWLYRIATNRCLDVLRRQQRLRWHPWDAPKHDHLLLSAVADDPEHTTLSHEMRVIVQQVLDQMTPRHRLALVLREYNGLSCEEIGRTMNLSRSAVKSMLFRARDEFRRVYATLPSAPAMEYRPLGRRLPSGQRAVA